MIEINAQQAEETCERITDKSLRDWDEQRKSNLLDDIAMGKLNPRRWFPIHRIQGFSRAYGSDVDLEFGIVAYDELKSWNSDMPRMRFGNMGQQIKSQQAFRLDPAKSEDLYRLYGTA